MADTGPSRIASLSIPSTLDLRKGQIEATFTASVRDPDGVEQVTVYYDRSLSTDMGTHDFQIIHGWGSDWTDGSHRYTATILPHNIAGPLNITHVDIQDGLGNRTIVTANDLRKLGVDTSIDVRSVDADTIAPALVSFDLPDRIDLRNGHALVEIEAVANDNTAIDRVNVWFDRDVS